MVDPFRHAEERVFPFENRAARAVGRATCSRQYGHSKPLSQERGEPDESGEVHGLFLVACSDASAAFDGAEESLDHVPVLIARLVILFPGFSCRVGADAGLGFHLFRRLADGVAVVSRIGHDMFDRSTFKSFQQFFCLGSIAALTGGHQQPQQTATPVRGRMQFGG